MSRAPSNLRTISGLRVGGGTGHSPAVAHGGCGREGGPLHLTAIHGILTRETTPNWPDLFAAWMLQRDPDVRVDTAQYVAGPFPGWNVWVKNYYLAFSLAARLEVLARAGARLAIAAHSNGCDIALKAARILARRGVGFEALVLMGGAAEADVDRNGIADLFTRNLVPRAIAYSSEGDLATASWLIWPYGRLGHTGWMLQGCEYGDRITPHEPAPEAGIVTRQFHWGHCDYFAEPNREATFEQVYQDVCNPCPL